MSEARRIAHAAGLTVFALVLDEPHAGLRAEPLATALGRAGADRVLFCEAPGLAAPALDVTHGRALYTAVERVPPIVVLFPTGGPGEELGPPLAVRLGAAYAPAVDIVLSEEAGPLADGVGRICLRRWRADHSGYRQLDPVELERPVVATLGAHGAPRENGTPDVDVEVITCPGAAEGIVLSELASEPDELDRVTQARGLVVLGRQLPPEVAARLRAAAPPNVVVVDATASPRALAAASPEVVLDLGLGSDGVEIGVSPRAPIALVARPGAPGGGDTRRPAADLVWTVAPESSDPWAELIAAWGGLR